MINSQVYAFALYKKTSFYLIYTKLDMWSVSHDSIGMDDIVKNLRNTVRE